MQTQTFHNTSAQASTARSSELKIDNKQNSSFSYDCAHLSNDSKKRDCSSSLKREEYLGVRSIDFVKHEDYPKLNALVVNLVRWESDITRYTGRVWKSRQQGFEKLRNPVSHIKRSFDVMLRHPEVQEQIMIAPYPVFRRGDNPAADSVMDQWSVVLCRECSDIFDYMSRFLVFNRLKSAEQSWHYDKDLDSMCHALSPFDDYELDHSTLWVELSEFWKAENTGDQGHNEHVR